ncbi:MAG: BMC domain-containing protein [Pseudonocardia sp.]|nr:BMC domain-containing protein [Pseudonocardia sp.]
MTIVSIGFVEAEGFVSVFDAAEHMAKTAAVDLGAIVSIGGGRVAVSVTGPLEHVVEAVEAAEDTIRAGHGISATSVVLANPGAAVRGIAADLSAIG